MKVKDFFSKEDVLENTSKEQMDFLNGFIASFMELSPEIDQCYNHIEFLQREVRKDLDASNKPSATFESKNAYYAKIWTSMDKIRRFAGNLQKDIAIALERYGSYGFNIDKDEQPLEHMYVADFEGKNIPVD